MNQRLNPLLIVPIILVVVLILVGSRFFVVVPAGHVAVATLFGKVQPEPLPEGLHIPINPLLDFVFFDVREMTMMDTANVPSQDQLQTEIDVSVQFRVAADMAPEIYKNSGTVDAAIKKYVEPSLRSNLREAGKSIKRAEDFFMEETQASLQTDLLNRLREYLTPKGIIVDRVFLRDISLPAFITKAIESKKEREQAVEKQKAELERFKTEQQQLIAQAEAERMAAEENAARQRVLADAQAYEIEKLNEAMKENPAFLTLQAINALKEISKDPAAKLYFINSDSPQPLPLMNIGDSLVK